MRDVRKLLSIPSIYQAYQRFGGFFQARLLSFETYLDLRCYQSIFDIGCGPGHVAAELPPNSTYVGFDSDRSYIEFATANFGGPRRRFVNSHFNSSVCARWGHPDLIMMNGLLHHLDDQECREVLLDAYHALVPGGCVFTLDGCFVDGQSRVARFLLEHDRGKFVRTQAQYAKLIPEEFGKLGVYVRDDLSRVPYTFVIMKMTKQKQ